MSEENHQEVESLTIGEEGTAKPAPKSGRERSLANLVSGKGRKPGAKNRSTDIKNAVLKAFDKVGGHKNNNQLANGTASDRAAFMNLLGKTMPKEINGTMNHHVIPELPWLTQRLVDKADPSDAQSLGTAGKSLAHQDVVEGEIITPAAGIPMGHPASADGGDHE